jgi:hypothetical protein
MGRPHRLKPVEALQDWLARTGITEGPLFRRITLGGRVLTDALRPEAIAAIVKKLAQRAGFDPATFAGHSLRSGFVTSAVEDGASAVRVAEITRHRSLRSRFMSAASMPFSPTPASGSSDRVTGKPNEPIFASYERSTHYPRPRRGRSLHDGELAPRFHRIAHGRLGFGERERPARRSREGVSRPWRHNPVRQHSDRRRAAAPHVAAGTLVRGPAR